MDSTPESRVLDAAYQLYVSHGMSGISMRRLADEIGVTAPAIYKHFDDKEALLEAVAERGFGVFEERLAAMIRRQPAHRRIAGVLACYRDFAIEEPHLFEIMFVVPRARHRGYPSDFAEGRSATFNTLRSAVDQAMDAGVLRKDDSLELTLNLWAYAHGLVGLFRAGRFGSDLVAFQRLFDRAITRFLRGLATERSAGHARK